jgi:diguanylate cyclase (GGDEF)-like protein
VEILVQYGMREKARERLQRIQELFPHEEERNEDLQRLYLAAGLTPKYPEGAQVPLKIAAAAPVVAAPAAPAAPAASDVSSFTRVSDISRKLYRQGNAEAVMSTTVNEIGAQWNTSRCVVALRKPGLSPAATAEYCEPGIPPGAPSALSRLVIAAHDLAMKHGTLNLADARTAPELEAVRDAVTELSVGALLALPLSEGKDQMGVLLLMQEGPRAWSANDVVVLRTISEQVVIALNNAGLRRLVKNLSVTDEGSGLLKRASYLDLLLSETGRARQQKNSLSVLLMQFGKSSAMLKEVGESAVEAMMQQIGQLLGENLRQNDLAFRYETTVVALVLAESEKEADHTVDKLRRVMAEVRIPGSEDPVPFNAGLAQAVVRPEFDAVDTVTEVINRAEQALEASLAAGPGRVVAQAASLSTAAVA